MNIAILGGAFDPPHLAHQLISTQTLELTKINQVWLIPCFAHPFAKNLTSANHRLKMARFLAAKNILVSNIEIKQKKTNYTIDTINLLKNRCPQHHFSILIGSDNLSGLPKWKNFKKLIKENNFLVFPRTTKKIKNLPPSFKIITSPYLITTNISSYLIRKRIKNNLSIKHLVPARVGQYMKVNNLYK